MVGCSAWEDVEDSEIGCFKAESDVENRVSDILVYPCSRDIILCQLIRSTLTDVFQCF